MEGIGDRIMEMITKHYIQSRDFNGILAVRLCEAFDEIGEGDLRSLLRELVEKRVIVLAFDRVQGNPHILRVPPPEKDCQLALLSSESLSAFGVYPTQTVLRERPDLKHFSQRPFTQRLALGEAQLTSVFFELSVLEPYYRDPRYHLDYYDLGGKISIRDEAYFSGMPERDKVGIQTFGVAYDRERKRVIVVFLRYLSDLTPDHQQIWQAHIVDRECVMNRDYERATLYGSWPENYSVYQALLAEMQEINKLSTLINKQPLFRDDFSKQRPVQLHPLLRPTEHNFSDFVLLFDKMLSENLNREFFRDDIPLEEEVERQDGKIEVIHIRTLRLLENWLKTHYRTKNGKDVSAEDLEPLKRVRNLRQRPAHKITEDKYDISLASEQDRLVADVVHALTKLRYILMSHPAAKGKYAAPKWLDSERIVIY